MLAEHDAVLSNFTAYYRKFPLIHQFTDRKVSSLISLKEEKRLSIEEILFGVRPLNVGLYEAMVSSKTERASVVLSEGLIKSYPISKLHDAIKKLVQEQIPEELANLTFSDWPNSFSQSKKQKLIDKRFRDASTDEEASLVVFLIPIPLKDKKRFLKTLTDRAWQFGWDYSYQKSYSCLEHGADVVAVAFEKRFTNPLSTLGKHLFHVCPKKVVHKILQDGIVPKAKSEEFKYSDRVYLFSIDSSDEAYRALDFIKEKQDQVGSKEDYCMVVVDVDRLRSSSKFRSGDIVFYADPTFIADSETNPAIFTYSNISPKFLEKEIVSLSYSDLENRKGQTKLKKALDKKE